MIDTLPQYEPERLTNAPLALVVAQIRFPPILSIQTDDRALARFQEQLRDRYPYLSIGQQIGINIGLQGVEQQQTSGKIYQFADADREWIVSLTVDSVALEARRYTDYDDFSERTMRLMAAVKDVYRVQVRQRLGLRYINEVRHPDASTIADWTPFLRHELLGLAANNDIAPSIKSSVQELGLALPNGALTLRHGYFERGTTVAPLPGDVPKDEGAFYLLDIDAFDEEGQGLDDHVLDGLFRSYNHSMFQLFRWLVQDSLYDYLKGDA
ncbi:MAG: TIGR04255 family protein [Rubrobacter sp.]